ncbi:MAG: GNAT family N-acetyltransferase [Planctomycetota bacterium]
MTAPETLRRVDAFWAAYFGCRIEDLAAPRTLVVPHQALAGYDGALAFRRGPALVVSVPETVPEIERAQLREAPPERAFDPAFLARVFVVSRDKIAGPAWLGIADRADFRSSPAGREARLLGDADEPAIERLAEGCGELAWKQSKLLQIRKPLFGLFREGDLVAVSGYVVMGNVLAYIGVITHPAHRGKGYAKAVVSAAAEDALNRGFVAQWRTPEANEAAVALARSMGFQPYARTYDVQLVEDEF